MSYNQRRTLSNTSWGLILFHKFSLVILFSCKKGLPLCCFGGGGLRKRICPPPPRWQKWHNFLNAVLSIIVLKLFQHLSDARTRKISWTLKVATQAYLYFLRPIAPSSPSSRWTKSFHWGRGGGIRQLQHFSLKGKQGRCNIFSMAERQISLVNKNEKKWKEKKRKEKTWVSCGDFEPAFSNLHVSTQFAPVIWIPSSEWPTITKDRISWNVFTSK